MGAVGKLRDMGSSNTRVSTFSVWAKKTLVEPYRTGSSSVINPFAPVKPGLFSPEKSDMITGSLSMRMDFFDNGLRRCHGPLSSGINSQQDD
jgi:hypothetical protein